MNETCGCCNGIQQVTPIPIANRPGLDALRYRVGTHASFLETMLARLSSLSLRLGDLDTVLQDPNDQDKLIYPLQGLTTRSPSDPAIAFLDAWAMVADVLTFYQERIANEGYLRAATERRSILELARLVGYTLRPGVAASVYLAYTLEKDHDVVIQPGNRAQSIPGPGELPQFFETVERLEARFAWNAIKARLTRPQYITLVTQNTIQTLQTRTQDGSIYLQGTSTNLKVGDPLLFIFPSTQFFSNIVTIETQTAANRTRVTVDPPPTPLGLATAHRSLEIIKGTEPSFGDIISKLKLAPSLQPRNSQRLERSVSSAFTQRSDIHPQLLINFSPILQPTIYSAIANAPTTPDQPLSEIDALRVKSAPFGHNAPLQPILNSNGVATKHQEWLLCSSVKIDLQILLLPSNVTPPTHNLLFGNRVVIGAVIKISRDDTQLLSSNELDLTSIANGGHILTTLDDGTTLSITATSGTPNQITFTFAGDKFRQNEIIILTDQKAELALFTIGLQVDTDLVQLLTPGENKQYSTDQHSVTMNFAQNSITVSVNLFASDANFCTFDPKVLPLDAVYDKIIRSTVDRMSWVVIERPPYRNGPNAQFKSEPIITYVEKVETVSLAAFGITGRVTQLTLHDPWLFDEDTSLSVIRNTTVYAQSEKRELAEEPLSEEISNVTTQGTKVGTDTIELDGLYDGLKSGQRVIVSGERTDVTTSNVSLAGIQASELVMITNVTQEVQQIPQSNGTTIPLPGDKIHTFLHFAKPLAYTYKRNSLVVYANVVHATHGETHNEVLGSGDGSKALQQFPLRQSPLTYVSAPTPSGVDTTLQVSVNGLYWHEVDSLVELTPTSRNYVTETDDTQKTKVIFGNGVHGARLPTGVENVKAVYCTGIGNPGNVQAGQISLLSTKPLGVKAVINPLRASGGADPESRDQARRNIPIALLALDRLVSVQDYEDFARSYAGIGKASAVLLSNGSTQLVNLTIVGLDNIPIDITSDLYLNLLQSLRQFGDPHQPLHVDLAEVLFLVVSLKVLLLPDYQLETVEPKIRAKLLDTFSFDNRQFGQPIFQSEVLSAVQSIAGVDYVNLETMGAVDEATIVQVFDIFQGSDQNASSDEEESEDQDEEAGETPDQEKAEEFLELLGLIGAKDISVRLAYIDPNPPDPTKPIHPAQLVFLTPDIPDTLIITELVQ